MLAILQLLGTTSSRRRDKREIETMVAAANTVKPISHAKNIPLRGHGALWQPINGGSDGPRQLL
jgi:hypothetical protein